MRICPVTELNCYNEKCILDWCEMVPPRVHHHSHHKHPETGQPINITIILPEEKGPPKRDHLWEIIKIQAETIGRLTRIIDKKCHKKHRNKPIFALTTFINKQQFIIMADVQLVVGSPKTGIFTLIDNKTLLPITTASFSNQAVGANSNPEFATFALDPSNPNNLIATPVAAGSGTVVITTDASYTDPGDNSSQSGSFSITKKFTVLASQDGVSFDVVFQ